MQGRGELLRNALADRIHQPYRAPLCPLLPALQGLNFHPGILGVALSGAGPSVLIFLNSKVPTSKTTKEIAAHLRQRKLSAELIATAIAAHGAKQR
jgi:homoserine kinase